jgi:hypothetical protein
VTSRLSLLALATGVYVAALLVSFPASVAQRWFLPDGTAALAGVEGTIWRGAAGYGTVAGIGFADLRWRLEPIAFLTGRVSASFEMRFDEGFARGHVSAGRSRVELSDVQARIRLASLAQVLDFGGADGLLSAALDTLELVDGWPTIAAGTIEIADLSAPPIMPIPGVPIVALGSFRATLTPGSDPGVAATVTDTGGPLELNGRASLAPDHSYVFDALVKARADAPDYLVQGLEFVTTAPNAEGQRKFVDRGHL